MKRRGSAMIFAVVLVASMTTAIMATVWLTSASVRSERIYEDQVRMRYALEAVSEQIGQDYAAGTLAALPTTRTTTVNGSVCSITVTDNSGNIARTMKVTATITLHGRSITDSKIVGMRKAPSPFVYALFVNNGATYTGTLTTGSSGSNGDVYFNGNTTLTGLGSTINGDFESTGSISIGTATVTGNTLLNASAIPFPTVLNTNYSAVANQTVTAGSLNGATFSATSGNYYLIYCSRTAVTVSGTFSGKGTVFVNGNLTVNAPITVANSSSRVAIIASGSITFTHSGPHNAYFYGSSVSLPLTGVTISKGALVVGQLSTLTAPITISNDPAVWTDLTEGTKHRLPGLFP